MNLGESHQMKKDRFYPIIIFKFNFLFKFNILIEKWIFTLH